MMNNNKMRIFTSISTLLAVGSFSLLCQVSAQAAAPYDDFKFGTPDRIDFWMQGAYSKTEGNFEKSGNAFTKLSSGNEYSTYDFDFGARTELAPRFHMYASSRLTSAESKSMSTGSQQTKTNTGFANGTVGMDWVMVSGKILVIPDFSFTMPFDETTRSSTSKVAINEGVMEGTGRLILRIERRSYRFGGYAGFTYRDQGRSMLLPYGLLAEATFGRWNIGIDARGYQSLSYDKDTDNELALGNSYFCPVNGCSKRYAAFNPSTMESNLWLRWNANPAFSIHFGGGMNWTGSNVSRDATFVGGVTYRFDYAGMRQRSAPLNQNFEEVVYDGVDQRDFNNQAPKSANPPLMQSSETGSSTRRKPTRRPKENTVNLQDELDKTEMQMESDSVKQNED